MGTLLVHDDSVAAVAGSTAQPCLGRLQPTADVAQW